MQNRAVESAVERHETRRRLGACGREVQHGVRAGREVETEYHPILLRTAVRSSAVENAVYWDEFQIGIVPVCPVEAVEDGVGAASGHGENRSIIPGAAELCCP